MRDYDEMIGRMVEADGVRMASGQHIDSPIPRHTTCRSCYMIDGHMPRCDSLPDRPPPPRNTPDTSDREAWAEWAKDQYADPWADTRDHYDR